MSDLQVIIDTPTLRKILTDKILSSELEKKEEILEILIYMLGRDAISANKLIYLLLGIEPTLNYKIGDKVIVDIDRVSNYFKTKLLKSTFNQPDAYNHIEGLISNVKPYSDVPYTIQFHYDITDNSTGEVTLATENYILSEDYFLNKTGNIENPNLPF